MSQSLTRVGVGRLCKLFGKTRHAYYDMLWHKQERWNDEQFIVELLLDLQHEIPRLSSRKIHQILNPTLLAYDIKIGWNRLHEIRGKHHLLCQQKKHYVATTDANHRFRKYPNIIRGLEVVRPEQVWVSDITYIRVGEGFCFLSLVTDAYSRLVVGYCLYPTLAAEGTLIALRMAIGTLRQRPVTLIHHSDRGIQYCCDAYIAALKQHDIGISMTENGDPYENALAERLNGILKATYNLKQTFSTATEAQQVVDSAIDSYNNRRPHSSIENLTPIQAHGLTGKLERKWKAKEYSKGKSIPAC